MKSGKLRRVIRIERATVAPDAYGTPVEVWADLATLRAELMTAGQVETIVGAAGALDVAELVFKVRAFAGLTLADRVQWLGAPHDLVAITDLDGGRGLELRCKR